MRQLSTILTRCRTGGALVQSQRSQHANSGQRRRSRTLHLGHDDPWLRRCWLHGASKEEERLSPHCCLILSCITRTKKPPPNRAGFFFAIGITDATGWATIDLTMAALRSTRLQQNKTVPSTEREFTHSTLNPHQSKKFLTNLERCISAGFRRCRPPFGASISEGVLQ